MVIKRTKFYNISLFPIKINVSLNISGCGKGSVK